MRLSAAMRNGLRRCSLDSQCGQDERAAVAAHAHYAATFITRAALVGVVDRPDGRFYVIEVLAELADAPSSCCAIRTLVYYVRQIWEMRK